MKKIVFSFTFFVFGISLAWSKNMLTTQVSENGNASILDETGKPVAIIQPQVFLEGSKQVNFISWGKDPRFNAIAGLPEGGQIGLASSASISDSTIHFHYSFTSLKTVRVIRTFLYVLLPYKDWVGASFQLGQTKGTISGDKNENFILAHSDSGDLSLDLPKPNGLKLDIGQKGLSSALADVRDQGQPYLVLGFNHNEPTDNLWTWKAGEEKDFDFTLAFNREFADLSAQNQSSSKGFEGYWCTKLKIPEDPNWSHRCVLQIEKIENRKLSVFIQDIDEQSGGEKRGLDKVDVKGDYLKVEDDHIILNLDQDDSKTHLTGTLKTKNDGKVYPITFTRGMDYLLPRVDQMEMAVTDYAYQVPQTYSDGWVVGDLRESPLNPKIIKRGVDKILNQRFPNIESLTIVQNGKLLLDEYFKGLGPEDSHQLQSITKTVLSILFGIAQDRGLVSINDKLYDYFPEYRTKPDWQEDKDKINLANILSMTSGLPCDDLTLAGNTCGKEMWPSPDWLSFVLSLKLDHKPGEHFSYCTSCMEPLGAILARKSGMSIPDFAQKYLYDPLGIQAHHWETGPNQVTEVGGSHWLRPRDMAKLGLLYLNEGKWNGKQIVSKEWVDESTKQHSPHEDNGLDQYGYLWWMEQMPFKDRKIRVFYAGGLGGQNIFVVPELDLVCVLTAANYKLTWDPSMDFFKAYVLGAFK